jgi:hypothetical protein
VRDLAGGAVDVDWEKTCWGVCPPAEVADMYDSITAFEPLHLALRNNENVLSEFAATIKLFGGKVFVEKCAKLLEKIAPRLSAELAKWARNGCKGANPKFSVPCCVAYPTLPYPTLSDTVQTPFRHTFVSGSTWRSCPRKNPHCHDIVAYPNPGWGWGGEQCATPGRQFGACWRSCLAW